MNLKKSSIFFSGILLALLAINSFDFSDARSVSLENDSMTNEAKIENSTNVKNGFETKQSSHSQNLVKNLNLPLYQEANNSNNLIQKESSDLFVGPLFVGPIKESTLADQPNVNPNLDITDHLRLLQIIVDDIEIDRLENQVSNQFYELTRSINHTDHKVIDPKQDEINKLYVSATDAFNSLNQTNHKVDNFNKNKKNELSIEHIDYWQTVYSIESKQGKLLFRPRNKARNCSYTHGPCGHHQLTVKALKDIGCHSLQCRKDRLDYKKSLILSKKLLALNEKRLRKNGLSNLEGYQKYLIHQQGANGIKNIIAATQGKKTLPTNIKKNMANNSPYSYKQYKKMGSKVAAKKFMQHWERKWINEKRLILASVSNSTNSLKNTIVIPTFSDNDLHFALNMRF